jgi:hypothetical protein
MKHETALALLALPLLMSALIARGQSTPATPSTRPAACLPSSSRVRERCEPTETVFKLEQDLSFSIELPPAKPVQCAATVELEYTQRNTRVRIEGTLSHRQCVASSGDYTLVVRVRDENDATRTFEFPASWQRSDDQPVTFSADHEIGASVDLLGVRIRQTRCTCADEPAASPP